jgi:iron complex outermembrane receptor protein
MHRIVNVRAAVSLALLPACLAAAVGAAEAPPPVEALDTITVSATRLRTVPDFDVPASVATIALDGENSRADISVTESLSGIPGLAALERQNYAQDTQLSIRGFGARSTFGVRGVRLYADGIPASMPDGQGQLSHFNATAGERIEIMRGPFSALYGNSSGGVVQLWSKDGQQGDPSRVKASLGSNDAYTLSAQALGRAGIVGYNAAVSRFETDGYRPHSAARRDSANARISVNFDDEHRLNAIFNYLDIPEAQDPLGLTRAQWDVNPRSVASVAEQYNTRKSVEQYQGGLVYEQLFGDAHSIRLMGYAGSRKVVQFLAIPISTQASPSHSGGVVDLDSNYNGADARWSWHGELADRPLEFTAGANFDRQTQLRRGYENFIGTTVGVRGNLRRNESNRVQNIDEFAQLWWQFAPRWSVLAGVRHSEVDFRSTDRYIRTGNPNDSGAVTHEDTTPVAGLMFSPTAALRLYVSAGRGFETPTFNELSYRSDGGAGLALNLRPAVSQNYEVGAKWRTDAGLTADFAVFRADTDDELAVARNLGGRSSFQNVGSARRQGVETTLDVPLSPSLDLGLSYTFIDATFETSYRICTSPPCAAPNVLVAAGSRIPGVARHQGFLRLQWHSGEWTAAFEGQGMGNLVVNDVASERAPGYAVANLEAGRNWALSAGRLRTFARIENLLDKDYIGSVIVNEGNGRFYETGLGRNYLVGAQFQWAP